MKISVYISNLVKQDPVIKPGCVQAILLAHIIEELLSFRTHYLDLAYDVRILRYPAGKSSKYRQF